MRCIKKSLEIFAIIAVSVGLILMWTGGNGEAFLVDDNRLQWYPVLEKAYEKFFKTGEIYCYDFYQMKGMFIASQGYYGVMNPIILIAYAFAHFVFQGFSTITIYVYIMVALGNVFFYLACKEIGCKKEQAFLFVLTYSSCSCFLAYSYWYYVFNNYFIIPLLIYAFLKLREGKVKNIGFGIILAFDMFLGNVQYTCYHYILFCITCVVISIFGCREYIKIMLFNVLTGITLSVSMFLLTLSASGGFSDGSQFLYMPLLSVEMIFHSIIPHGLLRSFNKDIDILNVHVMGRDDNLLLYTGIITPVLLVTVVWVGIKFYNRAKENSSQQKTIEIKEAFKIIENIFKEIYIKTKKSDDKFVLVLALAITILFFISFSGGGWVAIILNQLPVINKFRYLFKTFFVIVPIASFVASYIMTYKKEKYKKFVMIGCVCFTLIGCVNNFYVLKYATELFDMRITGTYEEEADYAKDLIETSHMNVKNYRTAVFFRSGSINPELFECQSNLSRNFPTYLESFSLAGYEIATPVERMEQFGAIYNMEKDAPMYANGGSMKEFYMSLLKCPGRVEQQLIENGVKYILLDRSSYEKMVNVSKYVKEDFYSYYSMQAGSSEMVVDA